MRVLPGLLDEPAFDPVRRYLDAVAPQRRLYALCRRLAALFDQYLLYRPRWLLAWEAGTPTPDCPLAGNQLQAALWRALVREIGAAHPGSTHGAARLERLVARLGAAAPLPLALPARVIGFGLGALPPVFVAALAALATRTEVTMLRIYSDYLGVLRDLRPVVSAVEARDTDLARQLRRAAASVALNIAEGAGNDGGTRRQRYFSALGSAREVSACLHVADALGYAPVDPGLQQRLGAVIGVLVRVTR